MMTVAHDQLEQACVSSTSEQEALIAEHLPLVRAIALRVLESIPAHVELDDLYQSGVIGLIDAAKRYDARLGVPFRTFAKFRIRGAILDSLRDVDWATRDLRRLINRVSASTSDLTQRLQRNPTEQEIADAMGISVSQYRKVAEPATIRRISMTGNQDGDHPMPEVPAKREAQPDSLCAEAERRRLVQRAMDTLPPRYQTLMSLYYKNELTMHEIGQQLGVNESRVSQIHKMALQRMKVCLVAEGVDSVSAA